MPSWVIASKPNKAKHPSLNIAGGALTLSIVTGFPSCIKVKVFGLPNLIGVWEIPMAISDSQALLSASREGFSGDNVINVGLSVQLYTSPFDGSIWGSIVYVGLE